MSRMSSYQRTAIFFAVLLQLSALQPLPGRKKNNGTFVHQVMIQATDGTADDYCGGALVQYDWAVSTLKCIRPLFIKYRKIVVISGFSEKDKDYKETRNATHYVNHRHDTAKFDIALVRVDRPFTEAKELKLVRLPSRGEEICSNPVSVSVFPDLNAKLNLTSKRLLTPLIIGGLFVFGTIKAEGYLMGLVDKLNNTAQQLMDRATEATRKLVEEQHLISNLLEKLSAQRQYYINEVNKSIERIVPVLGYTTVVGKVRSFLKRRWFRNRKRSLDDNAATAELEFDSTIYVGNVHQEGPQEACAGNKGWPMYCGDTVVALEAVCRKSDAKSLQNEVGYVKIEGHLEFIAKTLGIQLEKQKPSNTSQGGVNVTVSAASRGWTSLKMIVAMVAGSLLL